jgi:hypothetical protein
MHTQIFPRLEVFFLEEWIEHHTTLGVEKFYIYDTGLVSVDNRRQPGRKLNNDEAGVKWSKKPDVNYFLEYSDDEIYQTLHQVIDKFNGNVELIPWAVGGECEDGCRYACQIRGYGHCVENNKSDWWIHMDPDEYILPMVHANLHEFLKEYHDELGYGAFELQQRVFDTRKKDVPVRSICNWGYETQLRKCLAKSPTRMVTRNVHKIKSSRGKTHIVDRSVMRFNHYRGHPSVSGDRHHVRFTNNKFDKIDSDMVRFTLK